MSNFIHDEAEVSEEDEQEYNEVERKKLKQIQSDSSEEDDDEEDEKIAEENKGFINDDDEEEEDGSESDGESKRKRDDDDDEDEENLDDDDLDLIEENIGVRIDRKKKFKRLKMIQDEDSDAEEGDARSQIAKQIFHGSEDEGEEERSASRGGGGREQANDYATEEEGEESDEGSFIVDDEGKPMQKQKRRTVFEDEGLEAARDIFGCDFDYEEFQQYEKEQESEEDEYETDEEGIREVRKERVVRKTIKKSIYEVFEPSELEKGHLTDRDQIIRKTDIPERFQLRQFPVTRTRGEGEERGDDKELKKEAYWIYHHAFFRPCISTQEGREVLKESSSRNPRMIEKIINALDLLRNSTCEVPFIAFYRKEEVQPELNIHQLWLIYNLDEKWCQLEQRKSNLQDQYRKMAEFQMEQVMQNREAPLPSHFRAIKEEEIERICDVETTEQLNDFYKHFLFYYGKDLERLRTYIQFKKRQLSKKTRTVKVMRKVMRKKYKKKANIEDDDEGTDGTVTLPPEEEKEDGEEEEEEEVETEVETEVEEEVEEEPLEDENERLKKAVRRPEYELLRRANIDEFVCKYGLEPEQFAVNLRDSYQRYDVEQCQEDPMALAEQFVSKMCSSAEVVLEASVQMVGWQLACQPLIRQTIREVYFERAKITVRPTSEGIKIIDEHHMLYSLKYIKDKPVSDLQGDDFLKIKATFDEKHLKFTLCDSIEGTTTNNYLNEMKQLFYRDEFSQLVQDWNELRGRAVEVAYNIILKDLKRELIQRLLKEAKDHVILHCCKKLHNWLKVAPYDPGEFDEEDEDDWSTSNGYRVFAVAFEPDLTQAAFGCCIDMDGDCVEYIRLPDLLKRRNAYNQRDAEAKEKDIQRIKDFLLRRKPHLIVIGAESKEALMIMEDMRDILKDLEDQEQFPKINVELMNNELARVYAASKKGQQDFFEYPPLLRQAVSLGRRIKDPMLEFSQLCNVDEEILNISYHPLQDQVNSLELLNTLYTEFINRANEVGVDLNRAIAFPYTQNIVQFVCGLGPRKAHALLKLMKQNNSRLENRNQLVMNYHMGQKVLINCVGFIKIDTTALGDSDNYIEVLDSTRIHPEAYEWARKMAVDALDYDDDEGKPAEALEEILETPEKLNELDLEAFAHELYKQNYGKRIDTLYSIRHELNHRYKDFRAPYKPPSVDEVFNLLTKETPETFYIGKLIQCHVVEFIHRKPRSDQLDSAKPVRLEDFWQCPFCLKSDFLELSELWSHFDAKDCPGPAIGIRARLDNGIYGFINIKNLSDKVVTNPAERVKRNGVVHARIIKIDPEKFSVELTCRTSDLQDVNNRWKASKDAYYDFDAEEKDTNKDKQKKEKKKTQYQKRVIAHNSFHNIDYNEAERLMQSMDQGDAIIRPSSKGVDHLTVTWKVTNNICQHIDVREQDKINDFSLGRKLWINNEEFEDLDEILARYIAPMAANMRQILEYKYYKESVAGNKEMAVVILKEEKQKNTKTIPYLFSPMKNLPGKVMLSYLPRSKVFHEYVTVLPEGFRFRHKIPFPTFTDLLKWFKLNYRKAVAMGATTPGVMTNRTPHVGGTTPSMMQVDAIHKVAQNMPSHLYHNLSAAAATTPSHYGTPFSSFANTPYTPSGQTPFMTPYDTPGPSNTPKFGGMTPSNMARYSSNSNAFANPIMGAPHSSRGGRGISEQKEWEKAALSWAHSRGPHRKEGRNSTYSGAFSSGDNYSDFGELRATPRSIRSTPKTIHSPSNMSIGGDQTPLYDE